jgi:transcriptional regulator with XRE-family HTH domain
MTLDQVAIAAGTTAQQIHKLETGRRRLTDVWMRKIAPALGVRPAALLIDAGPDADEVAKNVEEVVLLAWWRKLPRSERRMIAGMALARGYNIEAGQVPDKAAVL